MLRAKLRNLDVLASDGDRGEDYRCPECDEAVVLKKGWIRVHHFAHRAHGSCDLEDQSREHHEIKLGLASLFDAEVSDYEVRVGGVMTDFYFVKSKIAVKIQASAITYREWHEKTAALCAAGCIVLWVWGEYAMGTPHESPGEYRIPAAVLKCHHEYFGRVYTFIADELMSVHYDQVEPRESEYGRYYPKRLRHVRTMTIDESSLHLSQRHGAVTPTFRLLHLEPTWWK